MFEVPTTRDTTNVNNELAKLQKSLRNRKNPTPSWELTPDEKRRLEELQQRLTQTEISQLQTSIEIEKSIQFAWIHEVNNFGKVFNIKTSEKFVATLKWIQEKNWITVDGILWPQTLEILYSQFYNKDKYKEKLTKEAQFRLDLYSEMKQYKEKKPKAILHNFNPFIYKTYYWLWLQENEAWIFISKDIQVLINNWKIKDTIPDTKNKIIFSNHWWKSILAFYKKWILKIATYVSPWTESKTPKNIYIWEREVDMYHTSSEYPEEKRDSQWNIIREKWGAVMPYAIHVVWGVRIHWFDGIIDWNWRSHGCIRVPLFYIKKLYQEVEKIGIKNIEIDTSKIYN